MSSMPHGHRFPTPGLFFRCMGVQAKARDGRHGSFALPINLTLRQRSWPSLKDVLGSIYLEAKAISQTLKVQEPSAWCNC